MRLCRTISVLPFSAMIALRLLDKDLYKSEKNIHEAGIYAYTNIQPEQCPANVDLVH